MRNESSRNNESNNYYNNLNKSGSEEKENINIKENYMQKPFIKKKNFSILKRIIVPA